MRSRPLTVGICFEVYGDFSEFRIICFRVEPRSPALAPVVSLRDLSAADQSWRSSQVYDIYRWISDKDTDGQQTSLPTVDGLDCATCARKVAICFAI